MRRFFAIGVAVTALGACGSGDTSDPGQEAQQVRDVHLTFAQLFPLTVHGSGFAARERIRVTLSSSRSAVKTVVADRHGRMTARFFVRVAPCGSALVRAVGSAGSRASRELPRPDCVEP